MDIIHNAMNTDDLETRAKRVNPTKIQSNTIQYKRRQHKTREYNEETVITNHLYDIVLFYHPQPHNSNVLYQNLQHNCHHP